MTEAEALLAKLRAADVLLAEVRSAFILAQDVAAARLANDAARLIADLLRMLEAQGRNINPQIFNRIDASSAHQQVGEGDAGTQQEDAKARNRENPS